MRGQPRKKAVGRPRAKSGLPAPIPGEPFSLLATLRRTTRALSVADVAAITGHSSKTIYGAIKRGEIPVVDMGFGEIRIDPKAWALVLEHENVHLMPSVRASLKVSPRAA